MLWNNLRNIQISALICAFFTPVQIFSEMLVDSSAIEKLENNENLESVFAASPTHKIIGKSLMMASPDEF